MELRKSDILRVRYLTHFIILEAKEKTESEKRRRRYGYSILRRREEGIGLFFVSRSGRADFRPNPSLLVLEVESSTSADSRLGFG